MLGGSRIHNSLLLSNHHHIQVLSTTITRLTSSSSSSSSSNSSSSSDTGSSQHTNNTNNTSNASTTNWNQWQQTILNQGQGNNIQLLDPLQKKKKRGGKIVNKKKKRQDSINSLSSSSSSNTDDDDDDPNRLLEAGTGQFPPLRYSDEETERLLEEAYAGIPARGGKRGTRRFKRQKVRFFNIRKARSIKKREKIAHHYDIMQRRSDQVTNIRRMKEIAVDVRSQDKKYQADVLKKWLDINNNNNNGGNNNITPTGTLSQ